jgi:hypothetical protein
MKMRHKKMARAAYRSRYWPRDGWERLVYIIERWERKFRSVR